MKQRKFFIYAFLLICIVCLNGCGQKKYNTKNQLEIGMVKEMPVYADFGMARDLAVIPDGENVNEKSYKKSYSTLVVDTTNEEVDIAYNVHKKIYPASMTKIMTGLIVIENIENGKLSLDKQVTLSHTVTFDDWDVMASNLKGGCSVTIKDLLYGLLIRSYNDCAVILAEQVAGSESAFVDMMNEKAIELGAVNTHFMNPHGLHNEKHYTTAYDLYLIFTEFSKHDLAYKVDCTSSYNFTYTDEYGTLQEVTISPTNGFLCDEFNMPNGYITGCWKSGTTSEAGNCLIMEYVSKSTGNKYISVVAGAEDRNTLYEMFTSAISDSE